MGKLIPARYIGDTEVVLSKFGGPYLGEDGKPLQDLTLRKGKVIQMSEEEVKGCTWLKDPRHEKDPEYLGAGRVVKDEHKGHSDVQLAAVGYEFHEGRRDFEEVLPAPAPKAPAKDGK